MLNPSTLEVSSKPDLRQLLEELYKGRSLQPYKTGQTIRMLPDEILVVCRGVVQIGTLYDSGDEALLGLACPSMPFGLPVSYIRPYQASAMTDVDLMRLTMVEVEQSAAASPALAQGRNWPTCNQWHAAEHSTHASAIS